MTIKTKARTKKSNIKSTKDRLRFSVYRSLTNIYAQIIDDVSGKTICAASSLKLTEKQKSKAAEEVGRLIAEVAIKNKVKKVVFDRGNYVYKGRIKTLADSARKHGLEF